MTEAAVLALDFASVSDIGGRQVNEDAFGDARHGTQVCFVIADGAGGHAGGQLASSLVVRHVLESFTRGEPLVQCIATASSEVALAQSTVPGLHSMSSTVAVLSIDSARAEAQWAHLGDTRVYLFRAGQVLHTTIDHSLAQQFVEAGMIPAAGLRTHPKRNVLYAAIGADGGIDPPAQPPTPVLAGDALLICTDGLWEWIDEAEMTACLAQSSDARSWLDAMCAIAASAHAASGKERDNSTAMTIKVGAA